MRSSLYESIQKPRSSAKNIKNIVSFVKKSKIQPNLLFLGTSVAFEGINLQVFNQRLQAKGIRAQSGACESALLINQHLIYKELKSIRSIQTIVHIADPIFPWTTSKKINAINLSMANEFSPIRTLSLMQEYQIPIDSTMKRFFYFRTISYRKDLQDAILSPLQRIKSLTKARNRSHAEFYHVNQSSFQLSVYANPKSNICGASLRNIRKGLHLDLQGNVFTKENLKVSDSYHLNTVNRTCSFVQQNYTSIPNSSSAKKLFFARLKLFYDEIHQSGHTLLVVFPAYSRHAHKLNSNFVMQAWSEFFATLPYIQSENIIDLRFPHKEFLQDDLFYDPLHLNGEGAILFTKILAERFL
ncbi:MAG: hypothetical protein AAF518_02255 [Spirochaetota bacterium]